jgi:hypothetical protein
LKITYEGTVYDFDLDDLSVKQAQKIEKHIGGTLADWEAGLGRASADCLQAVAWLIFTGGDKTPIADVDFKIMKLAKAMDEAQAVEEAERMPGDTGPTAADSPPDGGST